MRRSGVSQDMLTKRVPTRRLELFPLTSSFREFFARLAANAAVPNTNKG